MKFDLSQPSRIRVRNLAWWIHALTGLLIASQLLLPFSRKLFAIETSAQAAVKEASPETPGQEFHPNRTLPQVATISPAGVFSHPPKDEEFFRCHFFVEPLIPATATTPAANEKFHQALISFRSRTNPDDTSALTTFLEANPDSPWHLSLLTELGSFYRLTGHFSKAVESWEAAKSSTQGVVKGAAKAVADRAVGELAELYSRLGRMDDLRRLLAEAKNGDFHGPSAQQIEAAREGLWLMETRPETSFRCGPFALDAILALDGSAEAHGERIRHAFSTTNGTSMEQLLGLAGELKMNLQLAKRAPGSKVIVPSLVHWKAGHYAALVKEANGKYQVEDPTFGNQIWITKDALDDEASGHFLIPSGPLPQGWSSFELAEARNVWGKGQTTDRDPDCDSDCDNKVPKSCGSTPMAQYAFHVMLTSLNISDTPVGYTPPYGPSVHFRLVYNQREAWQPGTGFTYSNLGNKWTCDWISYITDDTTAPPNTGVAEYVRGGGTHRYAASGGVFLTQQKSRSTLVKINANKYEKQLADGSKQIYDLPDTGTTSRKIFMTQEVDPAGNTLTFNYDTNSWRIIGVTDSLGQVTTVSYGSTNPADEMYYKITQVTDPFGRHASFQYNSATPRQLTNITDVIGITSGFSYGANDFINSLTTPYGTTSFDTGSTNWSGGANTRYAYWVQATDPLGDTERVEYHDEAPNMPRVELEVPSLAGVSLSAPFFDDFLNARVSYYWNKKAWRDYPNDFTKAYQYHFLHHEGSATSGILESKKAPLEGRIWYAYTNQSSAGEGSNSSPTVITRMLDDGSSQTFQYDYNDKGRPTRYCDPLHRTSLYSYAGNDTDLTELRVVNGANNDLLASFTYNSKHLPLTAVDASGQTNFFGYNAVGQLTSTTNPLNQVTTFLYDNSGLLTNITGATAGATTSFTYDTTNRVRSVTDSEGYKLTYDYDVLDRVIRVTYPDTTFEQITYDKLEPVFSKDRRGHWSRKTYDALRRLTAVEDALGRITQLNWCSCGSLGGLTDPGGNTTTWLRDLQGRPTSKIYPDGSQTTYKYEISTSRLKSVTDALKQTTMYDYFTDNSLRQVAYSNSVIGTPSASFTYDTNYPRILTMSDGTGITTYGYNAITVPPLLGAGRSASVDGPLLNDTITYFYDELGRLTNQTINGAAQTVAFDSLGRPTIVTNVLGRFTNAYVGATFRISTNFYPNGQTTVFSYFGTNADFRLQTIRNQNSASGTISKFDYTYDTDGQIATWSQQADANNPTVGSTKFDAADQLLEIAVHTNTLAGAIIKEFLYQYDTDGNRTTESIATSSSFAQTIAAFNGNLNQLNSHSGPSAARFTGRLSELGTVTVAGIPAPVDTRNTNFNGFGTIGAGTNNVQVVATDYSNNKQTNNYQIIVTNNCLPSTLYYDANGNLTVVITSVSTNTYEWDAGNRLFRITQFLTNSPQLTSEFTYDGCGRRVKILEKQNGMGISTNYFVWCGTEMCEQRSFTSGSVTRRFFGGGEQISGTNYFFTRDHLGSVREMTDDTATIRGRYDYDPYGRRTKVSGTLDADFGFTGHYTHAVSGLHLAPYRAYDANDGRWLSRDPIQEAGGLNLYNYVENDPIDAFDALGLSKADSDKIKKKAQAAIDLMTKNHERISPWFNDGLKFPANLLGVPIKGCSAQADTVLGALLASVYDDNWKFSQVFVLHPRLLPFHQFLIAKSANPLDPILMIDPYENKIKILYPGDKYIGIILQSDTTDKPAGDHGNSCEHMDFY